MADLSAERAAITAEIEFMEALDPEGLAPWIEILRRLRDLTALAEALRP